MPTRNRRNDKRKATWGGMKNERGMTLVFVALGFMGFIAATMLAIDVGMLMTARSQAQNSADAGALAGAVALGFDDYDDRTPAGPAVTSALNAARSTSNGVMYDPAKPAETAISVNPTDVVFENDPTGEPNRVKVTVYRTGERGNPVSTIIAGIFGIDTADIAATATAEVSKANAMDCVKPFTIPDRWRESSSGDLSSGEDLFESYDRHGNPVANPDVYIGSGPDYTGYDPVRDKGMQLLIRAGTGHNISPSFYFSITLGDGGGERGADEYRWNIANCNQTVMERGDIIVQEPGNMMGPTTQGARDLWDRDPNARWNEACNCIQGSAYGQGGGYGSPRIFPIPLYDPNHYAEGKRNGRYADLKVANWIGFFLDRVSGNDIYGRIVPIAGMRTGEADDDESAFPIAIRLIK